MENVLTILFVIISFLLIIVVLLQSNKASEASQALTGGVDLFTNRKERGGEVVLTRITFAIGFIFFGLAFILSVVY